MFCRSTLLHHMFLYIYHFSVTMKNVVWDELAKKYSNRDLRSDSIGYQKVLELIKPIKSKQVLDFGCGIGTFTQVLHKKGANVIGFDISKNMVNQAKAKNEEIIYTTNLDDLVSSYDLALMNFVTCTFKTSKIHEQVYSLIYNKLKENGKLIILDNHPNSVRNEYISFKRKYLESPREGSKIKVNIKGVGSFIDYFWSANFHIEKLAEAGFKNINAYDVKAKGPGWLEETTKPPYIIFEARK